jgi:hypothetical protein
LDNILNVKKFLEASKLKLRTLDVYCVELLQQNRELYPTGIISYRCLVGWFCETYKFILTINSKYIPTYQSKLKKVKNAGPEYKFD